VPKQKSIPHIAYHAAPQKVLQTVLNNKTNSRKSIFNPIPYLCVIESKMAAEQIAKMAAKAAEATNKWIKTQQVSSQPKYGSP